MADQRQVIIDSITELENVLAEMESAENQYQSGDMVNYTYDGQTGVASVESQSDDMFSVRVMAVAGDNYEPTDDVLLLAADEISPMGGDGSDKDEPAPEDDDDKPDKDSDTDTDKDPDKDDDEEEELKKGVFVSWASKYGKTHGKVVEVSDAEDVTIPETGDVYPASKTAPVALVEVYQDSKGWEDTGIHVALPCKSLEVTDPLEVKQRTLMIKMKNAEVGYADEEQKIGTFRDIGSAYGKVDLGGDTVEKGAYTQTINHNEGKVQLMFDHGYKVHDVAGIAGLVDTKEGLEIDAKMPLHIPSVKQAYDIIKFMQEEGKPLGLSIGYFPVKAAPGPNGTRILKEIALEEVTITPYPMDTYARIRSAKDRKNTYNSKRRGWSQLVKAKPASLDAPTGNQACQDEIISLGNVITEINTQMENNHV